MDEIFKISTWLDLSRATASVSCLDDDGVGIRRSGLAVVTIAENMKEST